MSSVSPQIKNLAITGITLVGAYVVFKVATGNRSGGSITDRAADRTEDAVNDTKDAVKDAVDSKK